MTRRLFAILRFLFRRERLERDLDRELQYHLERQTELNIGRGMTPAEARRQAVLSVGGVEALKDECREARLGRVVETLLQDVRYGARMIRRNPGFSAVVILTLALGIGANTAIFSVVYGVLLRPLPYIHGGRLVVLHQPLKSLQVPDVGFSVQEIQDYRDHSHTLESVVEHHNMNFLLLGKDTAERVDTGVVSANFFDVLGVKPLLGRTFLPRDDQPGSEAVLVLTYKYWQTNQGGDPNIVGKVFQMNNAPHTVIGVLPPIPQYPVEVDVYMPTSHCPFRSNPKTIANRRARMLNAFALLKPGVGLRQAQADLAVAASAMANAHPDVYAGNQGFGVEAAPLEDELTRRARTAFLVLLSGAGFILLIACANVANLMLSRMLKLEQEFVVRAALGAGKLRLMRQMLTESVMLSAAGGALGLLLAPAALAVLVKFAATYTTRAAEVRIDGPVLLFTLLVSLGAGILFGLTPALSSNRWAAGISGGGSRVTAGRASHRLRGALVVAQVAVSFVLLVGAGLMARSFVALLRVNPGFRPDHLLTLRISPGFTRYSTRQSGFELGDRVLAKARALAGIESAAFTQSTPFAPGAAPGAVGFEIEGQPESASRQAPAVDITIVGANYFETIRQPAVQGRLFTEHDDAAAPPVAVINQTMARHRFPGVDPVGRRIRFAVPNLAVAQQWFTIVGVSGDVREYGLEHPVQDEVYLAMAQVGWQNILVVRTAMDPKSIAPLLRAAVHEVDPLIAVDRLTTIDQLEHDSLASPRVLTALLGIFAALALLISASGIAAVMALSVSQRTHELGIRMALGAGRPAIVSMVVRGGLALTVAGALIGMAGASALTHFLSGLLYATSPRDVATFAAVSILFLTVAAAACFLPARQITAIDPLEALRQE